MKPDSAAVAKGRRSQTTKLAPTEGSLLRRAYDLFMANKGIPVDVALTQFEGRNNHHRTLDDLQDYYGLDIRKIKNGQWVLAGEWFGATYRDYIADRIHAFDRRAAQ